MAKRKPLNPKFIDELKSPDYKVRRDAVNAIGKSRDERAVDLLLPMLNDKTITVRTRAVVWLLRQNDPRVIRPLVPLLADKACHVHRPIAEQLPKFGEDTILVLLETLDDPNPDLRCAAVSLLGRMKETRAVKKLVELLEDNNQRVRWRALDAISDIADPRTADILYKAALTPYSEAETSPYTPSAIKVIAVSGLFRLQDQRLFDVLIDMLEDPMYRWRAASMLGELGDTRAIEPLQTKLSLRPNNRVEQSFLKTAIEKLESLINTN
ncbi:MAG: hypothetical protein BroJett018_17950 [Chloroflexota bacterium]|nr:HEAT repeat domain-containing protein [Chloroflexota bacterium]NOG63891.1 HEAT repeat domain-containing protein [Chloroflexota bacterium]GIK64001.1 MAG: hypothetical protein BroJett018_17950 [Chloroflexota bacterium]